MNRNILIEMAMSKTVVIFRRWKRITIRDKLGRKLVYTNVALDDCNVLAKMCADTGWKLRTSTACRETWVRTCKTAT